MLDITYPATYRDQYGEESILIHNNGQEMRTTIRGVEFITDWFFDDPDIYIRENPPPMLALLPADKGRWWSLTCIIPMQVVTNEGEETGNLHVELNEGTNNVPELGLFSGLTLVLEIREKRYMAQKWHWYFDDLLREIQGFLPQGWHIKSCVNCHWGEIQPGGGPAFGGMGCFRDNRERLEWARSFSYQKPYMFQIWKEKTEWVQEIHHCDEFELAKPERGYLR